MDLTDTDQDKEYAAETRRAAAEVDNKRVPVKDEKLAAAKEKRAAADKELAAEEESLGEIILKETTVKTAFEDLEHHPIADLFPMMSKGDYQRLKDDIEEHGLVEEITVYEGKILDGRNRHKALMELGKTNFSYNDFEDGFDDLEDIDAFQHIVSLNFCRRHLNPGQIAMVAVKIADILSDGITDGRPNKSVSSDKVSRNARSEAAKMTGASTGNMSKAKTVKENDTDLAEQVEQGEVSLNKAHEKVKASKTPVETVEDTDDTEDTFVSLPNVHEAILKMGFSSRYGYAIGEQMIYNKDDLILEVFYRLAE